MPYQASAAAGEVGDKHRGFFNVRVPPDNHSPLYTLFSDDTVVTPGVHQSAPWTKKEMTTPSWLPLGIERN